MGERTNEPPLKYGRRPGIGYRERILSDGQSRVKEQHPAFSSYIH
jgi:hypothetical protein